MSNKDYRSLSNKYRKQGKGTLTEKEAEAYLAARMPATYAAIHRVLLEVQQRIEKTITSVLDLGAGPGTATLAAQEVFPSIQKKTLIEKNDEMIKQKCVKGNWVQKDVEKMSFEAHDLGIFCYSFGELSSEVRLRVLQKAWKACSILVIVEAGTPDGYETILEARKKLIELGGEMIAPCPHTKKCPMEGKDWCHFSIRLDRSRIHKHMKGGVLSFEDEKYSYIAMGKEHANPGVARIVRHPLKKTGHVVLKLCGQEGLETKVISKKEKELYKLARRVSWGDEFDSLQGPKPH